ncbi:hypothetical protein PHSY_006553 [Pseudozyma hubeiensis SY62]|uniref:Uncharacterized protein n=1 Tax=Pseudozyma hubeiensis (strain SY62) TaxID=1305764 RepID=R9PC59_PSEHS|nr:hypothetical protein PHSY_006553 [Pseudozyma hubeiensis SY62]GAC98956.1 hypothetical protein PHSY_006553 [Pseudozyma hubeiensis SY62]
MPPDYNVTTTVSSNHDKVGNSASFCLEPVFEIVKTASTSSTQRQHPKPHSIDQALISPLSIVCPFYHHRIAIPSTSLSQSTEKWSTFPRRAGLTARASPARSTREYSFRPWSDDSSSHRIP